MMDEPVVLKAISALPSLAHLSAVMYEDRKESQALLLQMVVNIKSSLCGLHLPLTMDGLSNVEVLRALARVHRHLEDLTLHFRTFIAPGVTFTVRTLHLTLDKSVTQLRDIRSTFPNIRELSIDLRMYLSATSSTAAGIENRDNGSCWPSLNLLCAIPTSIRALGIVCPVRRVSLGFSDIDLDEEPDAEAVARLCPSKLTLDISCYHDSVLPGAPPSLLLHGSQDAGVKHLFVKTTFGCPRGSPPARQADFLVSTVYDLLYL